MRGFTLIELLIVIALIGALAVGLIAAIDPVDQVRRGQDVETQKVVAEYMAAQERAYASNNGAYAGGDVAAAALLNSATGTTIVTALQNAGEVKNTFVTRAANANVGGRITIVSQTASSATLSLAYQVMSKSYKSNTALNRCTTTSGACTACTGTTATCYVRVTN